MSGAVSVSLFGSFLVPRLYLKLYRDSLAPPPAGRSIPPPASCNIPKIQQKIAQDKIYQLLKVEMT